MTINRLSRLFNLITIAIVNKRDIVIVNYKFEHAQVKVVVLKWRISLVTIV